MNPNSDNTDRDSTAISVELIQTVFYSPMVVHFPSPWSDDDRYEWIKSNLDDLRGRSDVDYRECEINDTEVGPSNYDESTEHLVFIDGDLQYLNHKQWLAFEQSLLKKKRAEVPGQLNIFGEEVDEA